MLQHGEMIAETQLWPSGELLHPHTEV